MNTITLDRKTLEELKLQYDAARVAGKKFFVFQGREMLVPYAKYLIEYMETQIK